MGSSFFPNLSFVPNVKLFNSALASALRQMGFTTYDHLDRNAEHHFGLWDQAMKVKFYGKGEKSGRKDFDRVTKIYDVRHPRSRPILRFVTKQRPVHSRCSVLLLRIRAAQGLPGSQSHPQHAGC